MLFEVGGGAVDRPTVAAELTGEVAVPDRQELRLALVMTGGVSLAVWMGGATHEIDRLQRRRGIYAELLDLTGTDPIVDVISGSSAGGINGALLALAQARGNSTGLLRDLWLNDADIGELFRSPLERDPSSLMKGDELFLPALERAFRQLDHPAPGAAAPGTPIDPSDQEAPSPPPLYLILTGSLLSGTLTRFVDDFGTVMQDLDHKARFEFRRGNMKHHLRGLPDPKDGTTQAPYECRHLAAWANRDDFAEKETWRRLALASRSTASFPIAFEPSLCPVGRTTQEPSRPDVRCHASFDRTAFVVDGGVLVNKPLQPAIEAIFEITAERQVRRVLAYVVPDPAQPASSRDDEPLPTMVKTAIDSLITLPRNESIGRELAELSDQNRRARMLRQARMTWLQGGNLVERAEELLDEYRVVRAELSTEAVLNALESGAARTVGPIVDLEDWDRAKLREVLVPERLQVLPRHFPDERWSATTGTWDWGLQPVEDVCLVVMDLLRRGLAITRANPVDGTPEAWAISLLRKARQRLFRDIDAHRSFGEEKDEPYWRGEARAALQALHEARFHRAGSQPDPVLQWARSAFSAWPKSISTAPMIEIAIDAARILRWSAPALRLLVERARADTRLPTSEKTSAENLGSMLDALGAPPTLPSGTRRMSTLQASLERCPTGLPERPADVRVLRNLLAAHVLEVVLSPQERGIEQAVQLIQISSDSPNRVGQPLLPQEKLAGIQLGHFGAFYKRSWRANDWMWGRLDGAYRLAQVLVDPARFRQRGLSPDQVADVIEKVTVGEEQYEQAFEGSPDAWRRAIRKELAYLSDPELQTPRDLPSCVDAIARRIQLEIIQDELPVVASSVRYDIDDGAAHVSRAVAFADQYDRLEREDALTPKAALKLFAECHVGAESFMDERYSDKFARTVGDAAGISVSAARGARSGLPAPIRVMLSSLRGITLSLWILARSAVQSGRSAIAFTTALLAIGGSLVAVAMLSEAPTWFLAVGSALLAAGVFVASIRVGVGWVVGIALLALLFVLLPFIATWSLRALDPASGTFLAGFQEWLEENQRVVSQVFLIVGLVVGSMVLGMVKRSKPVGPPVSETGP